MSEETITLQIRVEVEQEVVVPVAGNYDLEDIKDVEADKAYEKYANNPELLGFEDIKFRDVSDVQVKEY
ncbi:hypothetical protein [Staphylococcus nepalensis]|jgi:hypothetical protein|uniref:Uncharacterized protein n=1 Tax=Staphylococcus nepalensis TaxID=214473 RepID=A0A380GPB0_9STAP|nr:hypothetical protein [Staphylococcus nepalensis]VDG67400.1 Uncharacterised protein [Lacrimispora indolis]POA01067.1 hypothetical protein CD130_00640 [Staphylococcus nepalensis]RIO43885.1 hypothetical protein BUZ60_03460 [Staphylococcus nepalensis]SUM55427.1 Uncharacterised protein [Staphylococcus nepalensis]GGB85624.1 hypothetical protein GCM10007203_16060 [Staphylococcus nepalensis]